MGTEGADALQSTAGAALARVTANLDLRSGLTLIDANGNRQLDEGDALILDLGLGPGAGGMDLEGGGPILNYIDGTGRYADLPLAYSWLRGEGPALDPGELVELTVHLPAGAQSGRGSEFMLELVAIEGGTIVLERRVPIGFERATYLP